MSGFAATEYVLEMQQVFFLVGPSAARGTEHAKHQPFTERTMENDTTGFVFLYYGLY